MSTIALEGAPGRPALPRAAAQAAALLRASLPLACVGLLNMAVSITDSLVVAALGTDALATASLLSDAQSIIYYFVGGGMIALVPDFVRAFASGDCGRASHLHRTGLILAAAFAAAGFLAVTLLAEALWWIGVRLEDPSAAVAYARAAAVACAASVLIQFARSVLAPAGRTRVVVLASVAIVPANAALDGVLVWGAGLGIAGAAAGTALAYAAAAAFLLVETRRSLPRGGRGSRRPSLAAGMAGRMLLAGMAQFSETGVFLASTLYVGLLVPDALPAHVIAFRHLAVAYCLFVGLGQMATIGLARAHPAAVGPLVLATVSLSAVAALATGAALNGWSRSAGLPDLSAVAFPVAGTVFALGMAAVGICAARIVLGGGAAACACLLGYWGCAAAFHLRTGSDAVDLAAVWWGLGQAAGVVAGISWSFVAVVRLRPSLRTTASA